METYVLSIKLDPKGNNTEASVIIAIPSDFTFADLHYIIQTFSNFGGEHFAMFLDGKKEITTFEDSDGLIGAESPTDWLKVNLKQYFASKNIIKYVYDTGNDGECGIELLKTQEGTKKYPVILESTGLGPAEDSGTEYIYFYKCGKDGKEIEKDLLEGATSNGYTGEIKIAEANEKLKKCFSFSKTMRKTLYKMLSRGDIGNFLFNKSAH